MRINGNQCHSSFTNSNGPPLNIDEDNAVFTVCSRDDVKTGGHASCYLERFTGTKMEMDFFDLVTPGHGRVQLREMAIQLFTSNGWEIDKEDDVLRHIATMKHYSYGITFDQSDRLIAAINRFDAKIATGRYAYSLPGGMLGRALGYLSGERGVNCADLILKILSDAGIAQIGDKLFNTPRYAAGSSNR